MASRTQLRLGQITGSFGNTDGGIVDTEARGEAGDIANVLLHSGSLVGVLSHLASSILRIHGDDNFARNDFSTLKDLDGNTRITYVADGKTLVSGSGTGADAAHLHAGAGGVLIDVDASTKKIHLDSEGSVDVDGVKGITITNASSDNAEDIIIEQTGANNSSVIITAAGTGADAIKLDATAGSMQIGPTLADGQSLKLGKNGATEIILTPHGTDGSEKISITNTSGTSATEGDAAITLLASAGGVSVKGNKNNADAVLLTADGGTSAKMRIHNDQGTAADSIKIESDDGGVQILAGSTSEGLKLATGTSGVPVQIGHSTSEVTIGDNLTIAGDLTVNGATVTLDVTNQSIEDQLIILNSSSASDPSKQDVGIVFAQPDLSRVLFIDDSDSSKFVFATTYTSGTSTGTNAVTKVGDADVRLGALNASNITNAGLTESRVTFAGSDGLLTDDQHFTYNGTNDILTVRNMQFSGSDARIEFRSEDNSIDVNSSGVMTLNANSDIILDADGDDIHLKYGTNTVGFLKNSSNTLILSGGHTNGNLALQANSGIIQINQADNLAGIIKSDLAGSEFVVSGATGNNLILGSNDSLIQFDIAETRVLSLVEASAEAILSSSLDKQLILNSNTGKLAIRGVNNGSTPLKLEFDVGNSNPSPSEAKINIDGFEILTLDGAPGSSHAAFSGSHVEIKGGEDVQELRFLEATPNGTNYVALEAPAAITDNFIISLPATIGTAGQVLKVASVSSNDAQLEFGSAAAGIVKTQMTIISGLTSGSALNPNSATVSNTAPYTRTALDLSGIEASNLDNFVDVFVNGQLLISGSDANVGAGSADYLISTHTNASILKFGFDLEIDDTVIINQKA